MTVTIRRTHPPPTSSDLKRSPLRRRHLHPHSTAETTQADLAHLRSHLERDQQGGPGMGFSHNAPCFLQGWGGVEEAEQQLRDKGGRRGACLPRERPLQARRCDRVTMGQVRAQLSPLP